MNKKNYNIISIITLLFIFLGNAQLHSAEVAPKNLTLHEISIADNGFLEKTAGDPYIIFPEIEQPICTPQGVELSILFDTPPHKPLMMELFWSTESLGFGEQNKVFFIIHPHSDGTANHFIIPLKHTANFTQIRLDFPGDIDTKFKIISYKIIPINNSPDSVEIIDIYYKLSIKKAFQLKHLVPFFLTAVKHGPTRLWHDKIFLVFWLGLLCSILYLMRISACRIRSKQ